MITSLPTERYHSGKRLSEFYPQDGGESQLASKLRHCHPMYCAAYWETEGATKSNLQAVSTSAAPVCVLIVLDVLMAVVQSI